MNWLMMIALSSHQGQYRATVLLTKGKHKVADYLLMVLQIFKKRGMENAQQGVVMMVIIRNAVTIVYFTSRSLFLAPRFAGHVSPLCVRHARGKPL